MPSKIAAAALLTLGLSLAAGTARADDCGTLMGAMIAGAKAPHAITISFTGAGRPPQTYHAIATANHMFIDMGEGWVQTATSLQDSVKKMTDQAKTAKMTCHRAGAEAVGGVPATIYTGHIENHGSFSDNRVWLSSAGLPVKTETKLASGAMVVSTFDYAHVAPPAKFKTAP